MTLFEEKLRLGGDPRAYEQSAALGAELAKLSHPAQPDMDWPRVERLCLALFREHGMELQSVTAFTLARAHLLGLQGLEEGLSLIRRLLEQSWEQLWPPATSVRLEMLSWLYAQVRTWLRGQQLSDADVPVLHALDSQLRAVADVLHCRDLAAMPALEALTSQFKGLSRRLAPEAGVPAAETMPAVERLPDAAKAIADQPDAAVENTPPVPLDERNAARAIPVPAEKARAVPAPRRATTAVAVSRSAGDATTAVQSPQRKRRLLWPWLLLLMGLALLTGLFAWAHSQGWRMIPAAGPLSVNEPAAPAGEPSKPIRLDGQLLFPPGKAVLRPESDKVLINSLIDIKAQPGWLIVITGHSDSTGDTRRNLALSHDRAVAVRDWMQRMGDIPDDCFEVRGAGDSEPVASDATEEGRNANRRVEITLTPEGGACTAP